MKQAGSCHRAGSHVKVNNAPKSPRDLANFIAGDVRRIIYISAPWCISEAHGRRALQAGQHRRTRPRAQPERHSNDTRYALSSQIFSRYARHAFEYCSYVCGADLEHRGSSQTRSITPPSNKCVVKNCLVASEYVSVGYRLDLQMDNTSTLGRAL